MLKKQPWLRCADDIHFELMQCKDEGKNVDKFEERAKAIQALSVDDPEREKQAMDLYGKFQTLDIATDYTYVEPSELDLIKISRPANIMSKQQDLTLADDLLYNKIYGGWLGRCSGCLLGQPVETWERNRILGFLKDTSNDPIHYYMSSDIPEETRNKYHVVDHGYVYGGNKINWINNVSFMPEDDDTNYTVIALKLLEVYGRNFTPLDVAECWLANLPILHTCTAERVAYKNLVNLTEPPNSALLNNPYREWIGAQIRADLFGYVNPLNPELAAEMAWRDASISHIKNGIYGEMFVAAMISAAFTENNILEIIKVGLSQIPEKSRLAEKINEVIEWKRKGINLESALDKIHEIYHEKNPHHWCHTISNAMIVCVALLYGESDFEKTIGIAVKAALDTDCNGATAGSILGVVLGADRLPAKWIDPLKDTLKSGVDGFGMVKISDLAKRTVDLIKK